MDKQKVLKRKEEIKTLTETTISDIFSQLETVISNIETAQNRLDGITFQYNSTQKEIEELQIKESVKELLNKQLEDLQVEISNKSKKLESVLKDTNEVIDNFAKEKSFMVRELQRIESNIAEKMKTVFPTVQTLKDWESKLIQKEKDLSVIEERWRRRYEEKSSRFKI